jgi:hypothetical protein
MPGTGSIDGELDARVLGRVATISTTTPNSNSNSGPDRFNPDNSLEMPVEIPEPVPALMADDALVFVGAGGVAWVAVPPPNSELYQFVLFVDPSALVEGFSIVAASPELAVPLLISPLKGEVPVTMVPKLMEPSGL